MTHRSGPTVFRGPHREVPVILAAVLCFLAFRCGCAPLASSRWCSSTAGCASAP
jgi:hypothetical protein